jgi:preprotein translocase subunit SecA
MSGSPIQSDLSLWGNLRTRRRWHRQYKGIDALASRWGTRLKQSRLGVNFLRQQADLADASKASLNALSDDALDAQIIAIREVFARRTHKPEHVVTAMSLVREAARRELGEEPYPVQMMGALGLFHGQIVEMVTGEGKTLTASIAAVLLAWLRKPVHVITVNDYLAQRDADSRAPLFRRCGLLGGAILDEVPNDRRAMIYRQPIVYTTQKELVADWLRDLLRLGRVTDPVTTRWLAETKGNVPHGLGGDATQVLVPGLAVAVVDEIDAVLIDEAVTPLIIAQPRGEDPQSALYERARDIALQLNIKNHFTIQNAKRQAKLTDDGRDQIEHLLGPDEHPVWRALRRREELVEQALVAEHCYHLAEQYQLVEEKVVIVDEYTGRFMPDRQWQHGLHQAVEAKHRLKITADRDTLASMSFQRFFKQYPHLCGMTGTAADARPELETTYRLPVRIIPTHRPLKRVLMDPLIFVTSDQKWDAIVREVQQMHQQGRPVLVGTRSIDASEKLASLLKLASIPHQVLNAVHHKAEAQIVSTAGQRGAVMVATNMAGRGTDIKLDPGVRELGGLHVILTERHTSRRVDRQLFGRSGRQGDPGSARAITSLEDDLLVKYVPTASRVMRQRFAGRSTPLPGWVDRLFGVAQARAQRQAARSRAQVLKHDEELDWALPR